MIVWKGNVIFSVVIFLSVLDVYTEWCGSAIAMTSSLKKIKLEQGGDDLHLAVVKCDKIDVFARFRNKSEPTWLLASVIKLCILKTYE